MHTYIDYNKTINKKIISILLCLFMIVPFTSCGSKVDEEAVIWTIAQDCVSNNLKSPSTAKFPTYNNASIRKTYNDDEDIREKWHVESYVDAQNSFGAKVRQNFSIDIIIHKDDTVIYENLRFY